MPKVDTKAVLDVDDIQRAFRVATSLGPHQDALFAWMYEFGARASEPGLQLVQDVDLRAGRGRPLHLKSDRAQMLKGSANKHDWHNLLMECKRALPIWFATRAGRKETREQARCLFPDAAPGGKCYVCHGTGQRKILNRVGEKRCWGEKVPCHHCNSTGKRYGLSRAKVHAIVTDILLRAGMPPGRRHPHVLRHSLITHLLDGGVPPAAIQERVGHRILSTTLSYVKVTKQATAMLERALYK